MQLKLILMNTPDFWLFLKDWTIWQFYATLPHGNHWLEQTAFVTKIMYCFPLWAYFFNNFICI